MEGGVEGVTATLPFLIRTLPWAGWRIKNLALLRFLNEVHSRKSVTLNILATWLLTDNLRGPCPYWSVDYQKERKTTKRQDIQSQKVSFGQGGPTEGAQVM